ncbi:MULTISPECIES: calcium/sodium antiporter [Sediminimonas]|uniref:Calcium/sodium antiporter n=1 Tax=Sediminimonas qiaohouensis TaxID=552061 RepID=A0A7C9LK51_9RHOB|nr:MULTISPECIES: calcium/sodium antiporter [Sediminimonas]MDR9484553.1 calcium/sodium antiporter [Sediminimonas sp.]MTJ03719.1 calcium/sodium antiporter [Sediminimonas qiaohouensis]
MVWVLAGLGLLILLLAGDALVRGAVNVSLRLGVPALIVSLTIVAFGTSAPEMLISVQAALRGVPGIAMGNVVGSNTANILLVLGIPAMLATMHTGECETRKNYIFMILASALFIGLAFVGPFTAISGMVLLLALTMILVFAFFDARSHRRAEASAREQAMAEEFLEELEGADPDMPWWRIVLYLVLGLIGLPLGADILVDSAVVIARTFGLSESVIGLTMVAVGTSLPELATTVMAALRREADVALGNVIGSNMFNLLAIIGVASLVSPIPVDAELLRFDLWVMLGASLLLAPFVFFRWNLSFVWGVILTGLYLVYVWIVLH